jgi:hypothetical protein
VPNFCVSLIASWCTSLWTEVFAERALDLGRRDREALRQLCRSPSYCIMPANSTSGRGPRANASNYLVLERGARARSRDPPRKFVSTTAAPSSIRPTGPFASAITNAGRYWSFTAGSFAVERLDRLARAAERACVAAHVGVPAALDDPPVGLVAVHRHEHAAAAGGDP